MLEALKRCFSFFKVVWNDREIPTRTLGWLIVLNRHINSHKKCLRTLTYISVRKLQDCREITLIEGDFELFEEFKQKISSISGVEYQLQDPYDAGNQGFWVLLRDGGRDARNRHSM